MTLNEYSRLSYVIGRIEGIACGCDYQTRKALLETCELFGSILPSITEIDKLPKDKEAEE